MLLFIHIPKTAGTSFRLEAKNYFGSANTYYDYGAQSKETSNLVLNCEYNNKDRFQLYKALYNKPNSILCGHFHFNKYAPIYNARDIICFIRKPEEQIRSHYEHFTRLHNYKKSFLEFIKEIRFINIQSKLLTGIPLQAIGFIGLTEQYDTSLKLINDQYQINIKTAHHNKNIDKEHSHYQQNGEELELIKSLNQKDFALYDQTKKLFKRKLLSFQNKSIFYTGEINKNQPKNTKLTHISGWITNFKSDKPCHGKITINDNNALNFIATDYRAWANEKIVHRKGYIGFSIKLEIPLKEKDSIKLYSENGDLVDSYIAKDL